MRMPMRMATFVLGLGLASATLFSSACERKKTAGEKVEEKIDTAGDKVHDAADKVGDKVGDAVDKVKDKVDDKK